MFKRLSILMVFLCLLGQSQTTVIENPTYAPIAPSGVGPIALNALATTNFLTDTTPGILMAFGCTVGSTLSNEATQAFIDVNVNGSGVQSFVIYSGAFTFTRTSSAVNLHFGNKTSGTSTQWGPSASDTNEFFDLNLKYNSIVIDLRVTDTNANGTLYCYSYRKKPSVSAQSYVISEPLLRLMTFIGGNVPLTALATTTIASLTGQGKLVAVGCTLGGEDIDAGGNVGAAININADGIGSYSFPLYSASTVFLLQSHAMGVASGSKVAGNGRYGPYITDNWKFFPNISFNNSLVVSLTVSDVTTAPTATMTCAALTQQP